MYMYINFDFYTFYQHWPPTKYLHLKLIISFRKIIINYPFIFFKLKFLKVYILLVIQGRHPMRYDF